MEDSSKEIDIEKARIDYNSYYQQQIINEESVIQT